MRKSDYDTSYMFTAECECERTQTKTKPRAGSERKGAGGMERALSLPFSHSLTHSLSLSHSLISGDRG
jgi:hypothetical protein